MAERVLASVEAGVTFGDDLQDILSEFDELLEAEVPRILDTELDPHDFAYSEQTVVRSIQSRLGTQELGEAA